MLSARAAGAADADPAELAYQRALSLYGAGDLHGALSSMRESHRLSGSPELFYNLARLEDEIGDCPASAADYRHYLQLVPNGHYRAQAEQASARLAQSCASPQPAPPQVSAPSPAAEPTRPPRVVSLRRDQPQRSAVDRSRSGPGRILGWSAVAAGGLAGASAIYFLASAVDARARFRTSMEREVSGVRYATNFALQDEQHRDQRWAQVLAVTGGALVGTGVLLLTLGGRSPASAEVTAGVWVSPGHMSAQLASHF